MPGERRRAPVAGRRSSKQRKQTTCFPAEKARAEGRQHVEVVDERNRAKGCLASAPEHQRTSHQSIMIVQAKVALEPKNNWTIRVRAGGSFRAHVELCSRRKSRGAGSAHPGFSPQGKKTHWQSAAAMVARRVRRVTAYSPKPPRLC